MNPPKITFQSSPLIWFTVAGESRPGSANREDAGLVGNLLDFLNASHIPITPGIAYPGLLSLGFPLSDAAKITAWLLAHGATLHIPTPESPSLFSAREAPNEA